MEVNAGKASSALLSLTNILILLFRCNKCNHTVDYKYVANIVERAGKDLNAMEKGKEEHCIK